MRANASERFLRRDGIRDFSGRLYGKTWQEPASRKKIAPPPGGSAHVASAQKTETPSVRSWISREDCDSGFRHLQEIPSVVTMREAAEPDVGNPRPSSKEASLFLACGSRAGAVRTEEDMR